MREGPLNRGEWGLEAKGREEKEGGLELRQLSCQARQFRTWAEGPLKLKWGVVVIENGEKTHGSRELETWKG